MRSLSAVHDQRAYRWAAQAVASIDLEDWEQEQLAGVAQTVQIWPGRADLFRAGGRLLECDLAAAVERASARGGARAPSCSLSLTEAADVSNKPVCLSFARNNDLEHPQADSLGLGQHRA
jgi:hypothetical protein